MDELVILKSKVYDLLAQRQAIDGQIALANSEISRLSELRKNELKPDWTKEPKLSEEYK